MAKRGFFEITALIFVLALLSIIWLLSHSFELILVLGVIAAAFDKVLQAD